jgi:hypothetical protein
MRLSENRLVADRTSPAVVVSRARRSPNPAAAPACELACELMTMRHPRREPCDAASIPAQQLGLRVARLPQRRARE